MGDFVVGIDEHDIIADGMDERRAFTVFDVATLVIEDECTELFRQFPGIVLRSGVTEEDFNSVLRIILPSDGLEAIAEDSTRVEGGNHETDFWQFGFSHK